jgi:hypothetical protein
MEREIDLDQLKTMKAVFDVCPNYVDPLQAVL